MNKKSKSVRLEAEVTLSSLEVKEHLSASKRKSVLCLDPSFTAFGYVLIEPKSETILTSGCIKTEAKANVRGERAGDDRIRRVRIISVALNDVINEYNVVHMVADTPFGSQHAKAAWALGCVVGLVQTISDCWGLSIDWFYEKDAKAYIRAPRNVSKEKIVAKMTKMYGKKWRTGVKGRDQAMADALLAYTLATHASPMVKLLKSI